MPELFVLQSLGKNRNNYNLRQSSKLFGNNRPVRKPSQNSFKERTEIYYVPETHDKGPIYNKQPHKSPTPSAHSDDLLSRHTPELYHLPTLTNEEKPIPAKKIYYRPLRHQRKQVQQPYKPLTPPLRKSYPVPPAPPPPVALTQLARAPSPPIKKFSPSSSPSIHQTYPSPKLPANKYRPLTLGVPQLYHMHDEEYDDVPLHQEPQHVEQPYKSPPPPPVKMSTPPPTKLSDPPPRSPPIKTVRPLARQGPELYHMHDEEFDDVPIHAEPKHVEQPYQSPPPPPPPPTKLSATPPVSSPVNMFHPPSRNGPELYHMDTTAVNDIPVDEEPKRAEQPYKSPPPPVQTISPAPLLLPNKSNPPSPNRPELYHMEADEPIHEEPKHVEQLYKSPLPSAKRPSPSPLNTPQPPTLDGPELYHIKLEETDQEPTPIEPKRVEQPYKSPPPPIQTISPLPPSPVSKPISPPRNVPELYYIQTEDVEPRRQATPPKPATPRISSGKNRVSPMPSEKSIVQGPEMYYLETVIENTRRSPSIHDAPTPKPADTYPILTKVAEDEPRRPSPRPAPPRRRSPSPPPRRRSPSPPPRQRSPPRRISPPPRKLRNASPLTLPVRKQKPVPYDTDDDEPVRRPSFTTTLQDVLTADRVVPLSTSKASDSIIRSMNKFRFDGT